MRRVFTVFAVLCLSACSGLKLAYQNADAYLRFQADKYFAFQGDASLELDRRIAAFLDWHRAEALPQYAKASEEASRRMLRGIKREDLEWAYDVFRGHARGALRRAGREMAPLLDALSAGQIARFEQRLAEENRKFAREQLQGTVEERSERRYRRNLKRLEEWFGPLGAEQAERVRGYALTPADSELQDRDRKRRQAEFVAILRAREARRRLAEWAADWDGGREPAYARAARQLREAYFDLLLDLDRTLTPQQRQHAARRMSSFAADFASLAQQ